MKLWKLPVTLDKLNEMNPETIHGPLGIKFSRLGDDFLEATMPVDNRTHQPAHLLHGGASVVLAESLGSVAAFLAAGSLDKFCVGIEINASHLRGVKNGMVTGRTSPIRVGKSLHVWDIKIYDTTTSQGTIEEPSANSKGSPLVCQSRLTVMVKDRSEV